MQQDLKINLKQAPKRISLKRISWKNISANWLPTILFVTLLVVFLAKAVQFNLIGNLQILAIIIAPIGIVAAGQTLVVLIGGLDLSVASMVALISVVTATLTASGIGPFSSLPPVVAVLVGLSLATVIGWIHGA